MVDGIVMVRALDGARDARPAQDHLPNRTSEVGAARSDSRRICADRR